MWRDRIFRLVFKFRPRSTFFFWSTNSRQATTPIVILSSIRHDAGRLGTADDIFVVNLSKLKCAGVLAPLVLCYVFAEISLKITF